MAFVEEKFHKGKHCYRCGTSKDEQKKRPCDCVVYGENYGNHYFAGKKEEKITKKLRSQRGMGNLQ